MPAFLFRRSLLAATLLSTLLPLAPAQSPSKQTPATLTSESPATFVIRSALGEYAMRRRQIAD